MGVVDRVTDRHRELGGRVVPGSVNTFDDGIRHDPSEFSPPEYGDYLATSNDVYTVANLRAKMLAKPPVRVLAPSGEAQPESRLQLLLDNPNPHWTGRKMRKHLALCRAVWGHGYWIIERGITGIGPPRELWPIKPTLLSPVPSRTDYVSGYILRLDNGTEIPFTPDEVIWFPEPNPLDEFSPLSPMSAARLAADVSAESMKANRALFSQGMMGGGFIVPPDDSTQYSAKQADDLERLLSRRFRGRDKAHRWTVLRYRMGLQPMNVTPKDAQFIDGMNLAFRQVARAMGVPPPLVGDAEFATLANLRVYERMFWEHTGEDEVTTVAAELNRQLTPHFPGAGRIEIDLGNVVALQEDEAVKWGREKDQITLGAITINEWREGNGLAAVEWGAEPWFPRLTRQPGDEDPLGASAPERGHAAEPRSQDGRRAARPADFRPEEDGLRDAWTAINDRVRSAVLQRLRQRGARTIEQAARDPFDLVKWTDRTHGAINAKYVAAGEKAILLEGRGLGMTAEEIAKAIEKRATTAALERQAMKFAKRTTKTTHDTIKRVIQKGLRKNETIAQITRRVAHVMDVREGAARTIARSEITRARTTGQLAAYDAAGVDFKKWVTVGDNEVRDTHIRVNGTVLPVGQNFNVGSGSGSGPGRIGVAAEDVNCRCWLEALKSRTVPAGQVHELGAILGSISGG